MTRPQDDRYERALSDPGFLEAVRSHHTGSWDVLDALWWASHPLDASPNGAAAPQAQVRVLQRRVFAADADAAGDHGVHGELQRLQADIARESAAIDAAVRAAAVLGAGADSGAGPALAVSAEPAEPAGADDADAAEPAPARYRGVLLAAGLTAAVLLGAVGGSQLSAATRPGAAPAPSATASATSTPPPLALTIFQREPMPEDLPAVSLPAEFDASTVRQLGSMGSVDADPSWTTYYYVARTTSNMVCLIVVSPATAMLSTCTLEQDFPSTGLRLYWQSEGTFGGTGAETGPVNAVLTWRLDGSVEVGAVGAEG